MSTTIMSRRGIAALALALAGAAAAVLLSPPAAPALTITDSEMRDRIQGAWVGGIAGAAWGEPTEFQFNGRMVPPRLIPRFTMRSANAYTFGERGGPDETYVELPFLEALRRDVHAGWPEWGAGLAASRFRLFSANLRARLNLRRGIAAPASGDPGHNPFATNIDFQIESDFAGLVAPAQPGAAVDLAWRAGHVMNYGDGVYGGVMVAAMNSEAFRARSIAEIVEAGRQSVPEGSSYRAMIEDVIRWHRADPRSWRTTWRRLERRWNAHDPAVKRDPRYVKHEFNIDARLNGGYILMALLYGHGDFTRTVHIAIAAGQDSDCNPNNAGSIIGAWRGFRRLPARFKRGLRYGRSFPQAGYTLRRAIDSTLEVAGAVTREGGGSTGASWTIPDSPLVAPLVEQWPARADAPPQLQAPAPVVGPGRSVSFSADAQDPDGIGGYWWSFGDLSGAGGAAPVHTYRAPGTYRVTVWAADGRGRTSSQVQSVVVP